jgi:alpha/beta superfamily hydrolase
MELRLPSGPLTLAAHLARPRTAPGVAMPGVVIAHGFPSGPGGGSDPAATHPELADRIANEMGWAALAFSARGCPPSGGDFSLSGWLDDLVAAARYVRDLPEVWGVWLVGFGTGGALAVAAAATHRWIAGVAALGAPADFNDWAAHPRRLVQHARDKGIISTPGSPPSADRWAADLRRLAAVDAVGAMGERSLLVVHGADDDVVPVFDARVLADAHGSADLRIIDGAGHQLRHDPRAVATLLGWLDRQRNAAQSTRR